MLCSDYPRADAILFCLKTFYYRDDPKRTWLQAPCSRALHGNFDSTDLHREVILAMRRINYLLLFPLILAVAGASAGPLNAAQVQAAMSIPFNHSQLQVLASPVLDGS